MALMVQVIQYMEKKLWIEFLNQLIELLKELLRISVVKRKVKRIRYVKCQRIRR